jgi:hypothetical protein
MRGIVVLHDLAVVRGESNVTVPVDPPTVRSLTYPSPWAARAAVESIDG